ncbi:MAG: DnaJ domain-containing protein [Lentisphaeria bacterium]|nr:DnaJ domain-containing protein [Lentisphaeria bacterium]
MGTHYTTLGIPEEANGGRVKAAYREKVKVYHPDRYGENSGPFRDVQEAYSVLGDPRRRGRYDRQLRDAKGMTTARERPAKPLRPRRPAEPLAAPPTALGDISVARSFDTYAPSYHSIVDRFWGNFGDTWRPKGEQARSLTIEVPITRQQAASGGHVRILVPAVIPCPACGGSGGIGLFECFQCHGMRRVADELPVLLDFPAGIPGNYAVELSLAPVGIQNLYLVAHFRIAPEPLADPNLFSS